MKNENKLAFFVFFLSFLAYILTLCPTVSTGDSGELVVAAYTLSVPHSPGYPLYCLIGKLFAFIPIGSIAFRLNLMSAFFAGLSAVMIYFIVIRLISQINPLATFIDKFLPAISSGLIYAYSNTFWSQAVIAEVYSLWIFVLAASFLALIIWTEKKRDDLLYLFSLLYGISITCQQLSLLFAPGFLLLLLTYEPKIFLRFKTLLIMFNFFIFGLCLYLYIPLRAMSNPVINWNKIQDLNGLMNYLLRRQYGRPRENYSLQYALPFFNFNFSNLKNFLGHLKSEFSPVSSVLFFGFIPLILRARRYLLVFLLIFLMAGIRIWFITPWTEHHLYVGRVYLLSCYIIVAIFIGLGIFYLIGLARRTRKVFYFVLLLVLSALPIVPFVSNYIPNDQSRNFVAYDFGKNILGTLEKDAILFGHGDNVLFVLAYLKFAEKMRPDVTVYDDIAGDVFKETNFDFSSLDIKEQDKIIEKLIKNTQRPIYITYGHKLAVKTKHSKKLVGIVYKILREEESIRIEAIEKYWRNYTIRDVFEGNLENKDYLMREIIAIYHLTLAEYFQSRRYDAPAIELYRKAAQISGNSAFTQASLAMYYSLCGRHQEAISASKRAVSIAPDDPETYYNLGVSYAKAEMYSDAISAWKMVLKLNPNFQNTKEYIKKAEESLSADKKGK